MTTTPISAVFFAGPDSTARALTETLRETGSAAEIRDHLGRTAGLTRDAVVDEVGSVAGEILEMSVGTIFERSWSKYAALVQAAEETAGDPDAVRLIGLVAHEVAVDYEPRVEVYLGNNRVATVTVRLELGLTLRGVLVHVRDGCVTGIRAGDCTIKGALAIAGRPVTTGEKTLNLARDITFAGPIRLAGEAAA
ncbi:hypothetical protein [Paractinoplanes durhamensis]|uniref:Uncharacterized protein n=1 Tax=Paractinoplanes durhamensis TaxID=113563 RepID=A0ABQ3Z824_9ACTN|nr:hypothetical protein [Actinoplanes durhamensis]GIE05684.1 hypothetical protein Adu01nite_70340 [Actinoplanes durhamensis]